MSKPTIQKSTRDMVNFKVKPDESTLQLPYPVAADNSSTLNQMPIMSTWQATTDPDVYRSLNAPENIRKELMREWESLMILSSRVSMVCQPILGTKNVISLNKQLTTLKQTEILPLEIDSIDQNKNDFYNFGYSYFHGEGVNKNFLKAANCYKKAALLGHVKAQSQLGLMYRLGEGVTKDLCLSASWFKQAAEHGFSHAQYNYGSCLDNGEGVVQNNLEAFVWFEKAANQNFKLAQLTLFNLFFHGITVAKDLKKATYWYLRMGLSTTGDAINVPLDKYFDLARFIPEALTTSSEFNKVSSLEFSKVTATANGQMGAVFVELIKTNHTLISLKAPTYSIDDAEALMIMQALDFNVTLNDIVVLTNNLSTSSKDFENTLDVKSQFLDVCSRNKDIFVLREYLKNYLLMMGNPPIKFFDEVPSEVMQVLADQIIAVNIKNGLSKEITKALLDEFLMSSMKQAITTPVKAANGLS